MSKEVMNVKLLCLLLVLMMLTGCSQGEPAMVSAPAQAESVTESAGETAPPTTVAPDPIEELLESMSVEEKVGQLFLVQCPQEEALQQIPNYRFGGIILYGEDFENQTPQSISRILADYQEASHIPMLIAVDEEGGTVCRVSSHKAFRSSPFPSPRSLYEKGGMESALGAEAEKAYLLSSLGINVNMAPVCDITTSRSAFMYRRSLGQDPETTGEYATAAGELMKAFGVGAVWKHFPGYGDNADTHVGIARDTRSLAELEARDLVPFSMGIVSGCDAILVSHNIITALDSENPATLSPAVIGYLRDTLGFQGVIVTDDLMMDAILQMYDMGEAAVLAVLAGNDLLCSTEYSDQYNAVLEAVQSGRIPEGLLNNAVMRILRWKQSLGLLEQ